MGAIVSSRRTSSPAVDAALRPFRNIDLNRGRVIGIAIVRIQSESVAVVALEASANLLLYAVDTGLSCGVVRAHSSNVRAVGVSGCGIFVWSFSSSGEVCLYNCQHGQLNIAHVFLCTKVHRGLRAAVMPASEGASCLSICTGDKEGRIIGWSLRENGWIPLQVFSGGHVAAVTSMSVPKGSENVLVSGDVDGYICVWDLSNSTLLHKRRQYLQEVGALSSLILFKPSSESEANVRPQSLFLFSASTDRLVRLSEFAIYSESKDVMRLQYKQSREIHRRGRVRCMCPIGNDCIVLVSDFQCDSCILHVDLSSAQCAPALNRIYSLSVNASARTIAVDGSIIIMGGVGDFGLNQFCTPSLPGDPDHPVTLVRTRARSHLNGYTDIRTRRNEQDWRDCARSLLEFEANLQKVQLRIKFEGEDGVDEGGVRREWLSLVLDRCWSSAMSRKRQRVRRGKLPYFDCLDDARLAGLLLGLCCREGVGLSGKSKTPESAVDELVASCLLLGSSKAIPASMWVHSACFAFPEHKRHLTLLSLRSAEVDSWGIYFETSGGQPLKAGGSSMRVTRRRAVEYATLLSMYLLADDAGYTEGPTSPQQAIADMSACLHKLCEGWNVIFSPNMLEHTGITGSGLSTALSAPAVTPIQYGDAGVLSLRNSTAVILPTTASEQRVRKVLHWFWSVVREHIGMESLLLFATGTSEWDRCAKFPLQLQLVDLTPEEAQRPKLPSASTCSSTLVLPMYSSKSTLRQKLLLAVREGGEFHLC